MNRIVYKNSDGSIAILVPSEQALISVGIEAIAEKDVPTDLPFWFVNAAEIPTDRSQREAWEIGETMGDPDGFGGESNEFTDEQLLAFRRADNV